MGDIVTADTSGEDVFESFYARRGLPFNDTELSGRSDYGPFIAVGIPPAVRSSEPRA